MPLDVPPSGPPIVVTRHPALVALLVERGLIPPDAPVSSGRGGTRSGGSGSPLGTEPRDRDNS